MKSEIQKNFLKFEKKNFYTLEKSEKFFKFKLYKRLKSELHTNN